MLVILGWIIGIVGCALFQYGIWRSLREEYEETEIITFGWVSLVVWIVAGWLTGSMGVNSQGWSYWWIGGRFNLIWALAISQIFSVWWCWLKNWKTWPTVESLLGGYLAMGFGLGFFQMIFGGGRWWIITILAVSYGLFMWLSRHYRRWGWYKSGKKGIAYLITAMVIMAGLTGGVYAGGEWATVAGKVIVLFFFAMSLILAWQLFILSQDK